MPKLSFKSDPIITDSEELNLSLIKRLHKDTKDAAKLLRLLEARWLCDEYYVMQDNRTRSANQVRSRIQNNDETVEPNAIVNFLASQTLKLENIIKASLGVFAMEYKVGAWLRSQTGIGPVFSAYFLTTLDIRKSPYEGGFLKYAGMTANSKWEKGKKRPWNSDLKSKLWLLSETMYKFQNNEDCFYGKYFVARKKLLIQQNFAGKFANENIPFSAEHYREKVGDDTDAYYWYNGCLTVAAAEKIYSEQAADKRTKLLKELAKKPGEGLKMLPPAHIHRRAGRLMITLFLSHLFNIMHRDYYEKEPPKPYPYEVLKHADGSYIAPPNFAQWEFAKGKSLKELYA